MGASSLIRLGILTSSRADFGIYLPLLNRIKLSSAIKADIIAFGTHLSHAHGYTLQEIIDNGFEVSFTIDSLLASDTPSAIATSFALTGIKFSEFWKSESSRFDFILCLGDRFEMAAAVMAGIPFGLRFIHLHAGETTRGAFDDIYRDAITLASSIQFVATVPYKEKVKRLLGNDLQCHVVGSLSLDQLETMTLLNVDQFFAKWFIDLSKPTILVTLHPETVAFKMNEKFANEAFQALATLAKTKQILITMPNADTSGQVFRSYFFRLKEEYPKQIYLVENLGKQSYFTCMKFADHLIGNTSSGIIEAASFNKFVINVGDRQAGRLTSDNIVNVPFNANAILEASKKVSGKLYAGDNVYFSKAVAENIIQIISEYGASV